VIRMAMAWLIGVNWLRDRILLRNLWLVPVRDLLSFVIWMLSWVGRKVEWRRRFFEVARDGRIVLAK
jgi:ceramide glucosyltransferase